MDFVTGDFVNYIGDSDGYELSRLKAQRVELTFEGYGDTDKRTASISYTTPEGRRRTGQVYAKNLVFVRYGVESEEG